MSPGAEKKQAYPSDEIPLHNEEAEVATLGAILLDPQSLTTVSATLQITDFYKIAHAKIFQAFLALSSRSLPIDLISVSDELQARGVLGECGGAARIAALTSAVPSSANVMYYAQSVKECAEKRRIASVLREALQEVTASPASPVQEIAERIARKLNPQSGPAGIRIPIRVATVADIFNYPDPEYLVEGLLIRNTVTILSGFTGTGKTLVAHEIERSVCDEFPAFGNPAFKVRRPGPVLVFDEETPAAFLKHRLQAMGFREDLPFYCTHFSGLRIDADRDFEIMRAVIEEIHPALIVFDSLIRFHTADENEATEMSRVMERFRILANITTVLVIHHWVKSLVDMRMRSRGSGDIVGAVDLELALTPDSDCLICQSVKSRTRPIEAFRLKIEEQDGKLVVSWQGNQQAPGKKLADAVREVITGRALGVKEIMEALASKGIDAPRSSIRRALADLSGEVKITVGARDKKTYEVAGGHDMAKGLAN